MNLSNVFFFLYFVKLYFYCHGFKLITNSWIKYPTCIPLNSKILYLWNYKIIFKFQILSSVYWNVLIVTSTLSDSQLSWQLLPACFSDFKCRQIFHLQKQIKQFIATRALVNKLLLYNAFKRIVHCGWFKVHVFWICTCNIYVFENLSVFRIDKYGGFWKDRLVMFTEW